MAVMKHAFVSHYITPENGGKIVHTKLFHKFRNARYFSPRLIYYEKFRFIEINGQHVA